MLLIESLLNENAKTLFIEKKGVMLKHIYLKIHYLPSEPKNGQIKTY